MTRGLNKNELISEDVSALQYLIKDFTKSEIKVWPKKVIDTFRKELSEFVDCTVQTGFLIDKELFYKENWDTTEFTKRYKTLRDKIIEIPIIKKRCQNLRLINPSKSMSIIQKCLGIAV